MFDGSTISKPLSQPSFHLLQHQRDVRTIVAEDTPLFRKSSKNEQYRTVFAFA